MELLFSRVYVLVGRDITKQVDFVYGGNNLKPRPAAWTWPGPGSCVQEDALSPEFDSETLPFLLLITFVAFIL